MKRTILALATVAVLLLAARFSGAQSASKPVPALACKPGELTKKAWAPRSLIDPRASNPAPYLTSTLTQMKGINDPGCNPKQYNCRLTGYVTARRIQGADGVVHRVVVELTGGGKARFTIASGDSLRFTVDGERFAFNTSESPVVAWGVYIGSRFDGYEKAEYDVGLDFIKRLADAKAVDLSVVGASQTADYSFQDSQACAFRRFVQEVDPSHKFLQ